MRVAVAVFPGSNADWDAFHALKHVMGADARYVFHKQTSLEDAEAVVIPGGFSYGDYLRCGAIARFSPLSKAIQEFAERGGPVLGICNGFQILTEMQLLPGSLTRNKHMRFECRDIFVRTEASGAFTNRVEKGTVLRLPIAHAEGRYQCDARTLETLQKKERIAFRYCLADGREHDERTTINGSAHEIAGIYNSRRNVLGLMPHPERASEDILGNADGKKLFESLKAHLEGKSSKKGARA